MKDLRKKATESADFKSMAIDSVSHVKSLLAMLFGRLELKEEKFTFLNAASEEMIGEMSVLNVIEPISSMESITNHHYRAYHCLQSLYHFIVLSESTVSKLRNVEMQHAIYASLLIYQGTYSVS